MKMPHTRYYILDEERHVVPCNDLMTWGRWFEEADRHVADDLIGDEFDPKVSKPMNAARISTVFLGLDHRFFSDGPPILFETMIFGGPLADEMWRYSSWDDAETGHKVAVRKVREAMGIKNESKTAVDRRD